MNGFNPFDGISNWHIIAVLVILIIGLISSIYLVITGISWLVNHVQFI